MRVKRTILLCFTIAILAGTASASVLTFDLLGYNSDNFTSIHKNYDRGSGTRYWRLVANDAANSALSVQFYDTNDNGQLDDGELIASDEEEEGVLVLDGVNGQEDGVLTISNFSLTLGNGGDSRGHHLESGSFDWTLERDLDPVLGGTATFGHMHEGVFNHVSLVDDVLSTQLWGALLLPNAEFRRGLGIDIGLRGPEEDREVPVPGTLALLALGLVGVRVTRRKS